MMINFIDNFQPNNKILFEITQLRRIPVNVSLSAKGIIDRTTKEGRLFPLALSEVFGDHEKVSEIDLDAILKGSIHPWAEDPDTKLLQITIKHTDPSIEDGVKIINAQDLEVLHPSGVWGFNANATAQELLRLHKIEKGI